MKCTYLYKSKNANHVRLPNENYYEHPGIKY